jgi:hypothetical protein
MNECASTVFVFNSFNEFEEAWADSKWPMFSNMGGGELTAITDTFIAGITGIGS